MIRAVIFDMDGVVSDTQDIHARAEAEILNRHGVDITPEEINKTFAGRRPSEFFQQLFDENGIDGDAAHVAAEKWDKVIQLAEESVDPMPGAVQLITELAENGFKLAVASSSNTEFVRLVLSKLDLLDKFQAVVTGDDVKKGKPDPEPFLLAASRIGVKPEEAVVIEDGVSGMIAAKAGGMKCVGLVTDKTKEYPTDVLVTSLTELTVEKIRDM
ncbi:MAG: HAD family phosphatase [Candidatus Aenigmatarchaeota archaeon]|nr:HAD family phosphatase [Nanoarchaeota archaeon]